MSRVPNPLLPAGSVAVIDRLQARLRTSVCTIQRPIGGVDASGAPASGYATVAVEACRVSAPQRMATEVIGGIRIAPVVDYEVVFARSVDVRSEDRILVNDRTLRVVTDRDAVSHGFEAIVSARAVES